MNEQLQLWLQGFLKSKTGWFGALLIVAPTVLPAILPALQAMMTPRAYNVALQITGGLVILLRGLTTTSVPDKVAPKVVPDNAPP